MTMSREHVEATLTHMPTGRVTAQEIEQYRNRAVDTLRVSGRLRELIGASDNQAFERDMQAEWRALSARASRLTLRPLATGQAVGLPFPAVMVLPCGAHREPISNIFATPPEFGGLSNGSPSPLESWP